MLGLLFVGACAWAGWLLNALRHARRRTAHLEAGAALVREAQWFRWWLRNAAEMTPLDPIRPHLIRYAFAAQLAPSLPRFISDLHSLAADDERSDDERSAAKAFCDEWDAAQTRDPPWEIWVRETGKPLWVEHAQREVYRFALESWAALLTRQSDAARAREMRDDRH